MMMNAVVLNKGKLSYKQVAKPIPGENQVLIKLVAAGVCGTDVHVACGEICASDKQDHILGHEAIGEVCELGINVGDEFQCGDRVIVPWLGGTCGKCDHCVSGREQLCECRQCHGFDTAGAFADFMISDAKDVLHLPTQLSATQAAPLACAGLTSYKALKDSGVRPGQWVAIFGAAGGLGHMAVQFAKAMAMKVICIDIDIATAGKEEFMRTNLGAKHVFDAGQADLVEQIRKIIPGGVHGCVVTAPSAQAYDLALAVTRRGGTIMCAAFPKENLNLDIKQVVLKGISIRGTIVGDRQDLLEVLDFAKDGQVHCEVTERTLATATESFEELRQGHVLGRLVFGISSFSKGGAREECKAPPLVGSVAA